jgi:hypothetical protein
MIPFDVKKLEGLMEASGLDLVVANTRQTPWR